MNAISWIAIIILLLCVLNGFRRGFVNSVFSTFSFVVAVTVAVILTPHISGYLMESPVYGVVYSGVQSTLPSGESGNEQAQSTQNDEQEKLINGLPLPSYAKENLSNNNKIDIYQALGVNAFQGYISTYIARFVVNGLSFVLVFLVVFLLLKLIAIALDLASKLPVLGAANRIGGLFFGLINGLFILWMICSVATLLGGTELADSIYRGINGSVVLSTLYNNNILLDFFTNIRRILPGGLVV